MTCAINVQNLTIHYPGKKRAVREAVNGLSFSVSRGEVVGFLGPNGAGKSSTLKALMGFLVPNSGTCEILGLPAGSIEAKRRVGYLPEVANYYPFLTPRETLKLYGELQGLKGRSLRLQVDELLEAMQIASSATVQNRKLSKGMLQRVGLAQALLGEPEVLILDEFTSGLDPVGRRDMREILSRRRDAGCTLFFSSHELDEVEMLCDRIVVINGGKVIEERNLNSLQAELTAYKVKIRNANGHLQTKSFTDLNQFLAELSALKQLGTQIYDISAGPAPLEDYFVDVIGRAA